MIETVQRSMASSHVVPAVVRVARCPDENEASTISAVRAKRPVLMQHDCNEWAQPFCAAFINSSASWMNAKLRVSCSESTAFRGCPGAADHVEMTASTFVDHFANFGTDQDALGGTGAFYYLAQAVIDADSDGLADLPELLPFVRESAIAMRANLRAGSCASTSKCGRTVQVWASPGPTTSTLHFDTDDNLLSVLQGSKRVALVSPEHSHLLGVDGVWSNHSDADVWSLVDLRPSTSRSSSDHLEPPEFSSSAPSASGTADELRAVITVVDVPRGSTLFIPEGWWHSVQSAPKTIAVNFWYSTGAASLWRQISESPPHQTSYLARGVLRTLAAQPVDRNCKRLAGAAITIIQQSLREEHCSFLSQHERDHLREALQLGHAGGAAAGVPAQQAVVVISGALLRMLETVASSGRSPAASVVGASSACTPREVDVDGTIVGSSQVDPKLQQSASELEFLQSLLRLVAGAADPMWSVAILDTCMERCSNPLALRLLSSSVLISAQRSGSPAAEASVAIEELPSSHTSASAGARANTSGLHKSVAVVPDDVWHMLAAGWDKLPTVTPAASAEAELAAPGSTCTASECASARENGSCKRSRRGDADDAHALRDDQCEADASIDKKRLSSGHSSASEIQHQREPQGTSAHIDIPTFFARLWPTIGIPSPAGYLTAASNRLMQAMLHEELKLLTQ